MNIYEDLTFYGHRHFENALNVGWIYIEEKKSKQIVNEDLIQLLVEYLNYPFNKIRSKVGKIDFSYKDDDFCLGFSEIRVISEDGTVFAAPDTILYNIAYNGYIPPIVFLDALNNGKSTTSDEYKQYIKDYNMQSFWGEKPNQKKNREAIETVLMNNDTSKLMELISNNKDLLLTVTRCGSVLNFAIKNQKFDCAKILVENYNYLDLYNGVELISAISCKNYEIASKLIDLNIPIYNDTLERNPLFVSIAYKNNDIAARLFLEKPELIKTYSTEFERDCDLLKWCAKCDNIEMFSFIKQNSDMN